MNLEKDVSENKPVEVNPEDTTRAMAYKLWMKAPNPMVTFFKTLDVTNLVKISRKKHLKFNMLLDWCIGTSAIIDTEIDGAHAGRFLANLQNEIEKLKV